MKILTGNDLKTEYEDLFKNLVASATVESKYTTGNNTEVMYPADGTFEDYAFWKTGAWSARSVSTDIRAHRVATGPEPSPAPRWAAAGAGALPRAAVPGRWPVSTIRCCRGLRSRKTILTVRACNWTAIPCVPCARAWEVNGAVTWHWPRDGRSAPICVPV